MKKKYVVELTDDERSSLREVVKKLKGTAKRSGERIFCSKRTHVVRDGPMLVLPKRLTVARKR